MSSPPDSMPNSPERIVDEVLRIWEAAEQPDEHKEALPDAGTLDQPLGLEDDKQAAERAAKLLALDKRSCAKLEQDLEAFEASPDCDMVRPRLPPRSPPAALPESSRSPALAGRDDHDLGRTREGDRHQAERQAQVRPLSAPEPRPPRSLTLPRPYSYDIQLAFGSRLKKTFDWASRSLAATLLSPVEAVRRDGAPRLVRPSYLGCIAFKLMRRDDDLYDEFKRCVPASTERPSVLELTLMPAQHHRPPRPVDLLALDLGPHPGLRFDGALEGRRRLYHCLGASLFPA